MSIGANCQRRAAVPAAQNEVTRAILAGRPGRARLFNQAGLLRFAMTPQSRMTSPLSARVIAV